MSTKPIYRPLFSRAVKLLRQQPRLCFLGILAGLINTGAVLEIGFRVLTPVDPNASLTKLFLTNAIPGFDSLRLFFNQFALLSPVRATITIILINVVLLILIVLAVLAQKGLIKGGLSKRKLKTEQLLKIRPINFSRILVVDVTAKILVGTLLALSSIPLVMFHTSILENTIAAFVTLVILIILILIISLFSILTIASIVRGKHTLSKAIEETWIVFKKHPLVCFETALLLFLFSLAGAVAVFLFWLLLWLPYSLAFTVAVITSSTYVTSVVSLVIGVIGTVVTVLVGGIITAYQYVVWTLVYEKLRTKGLQPKLRRFAKTFRIL